MRETVGLKRELQEWEGQKETSCYSVDPLMCAVGEGEEGNDAFDTSVQLS